MRQLLEIAEKEARRHMYSPPRELTRKAIGDPEGKVLCAGGSTAAFTFSASWHCLSLASLAQLYSKARETLSIERRLQAVGRLALAIMHLYRHVYRCASCVGSKDALTSGFRVNLAGDVDRDH